MTCCCGHRRRHHRHHCCDSPHQPFPPPGYGPWAYGPPPGHWAERAAKREELLNRLASLEEEISGLRQDLQALRAEGGKSP